MKKWKIQENNSIVINELCNQTGYSNILISLLVQKGIKTPHEIEKFINPRISDLYNPFLFNDMEKAVDRIKRAIKDKEKILIYGDRDVDGITSTNIAFLYLKELGADVLWYVPLDEGYGLHKSLIEKYHKEGVKLIITVDCGISAKEEVDFAKSLGVDVIISDHHEPPDYIPEAVAVINPKCSYEKYPFKGLAGCGVTFKLFQSVAFSYSKYYNKGIVVLDIETTGLSSLTDEIVEIGAVKIKNFIEIGRFQTLVKPICLIPEAVSEIHGITNDDCKTAPDISEVMKKFLNFIGNSIIVAHNSSFDMAFLHRAAKKIGREIPNEVIDTLEMSRLVFPFKSHKLEALSKELNIESDKYHRALSDAITTMKVFERIVLIQEEKQRKFIEEYLYLVALGTVADIVPLVSENRIFVKYGIPLFYSSKKPGIRAILNTLKIDEKAFTARKVSWSIVPILNSAGRYGKADLSAELLITTDKKRCEILVDRIFTINNERKSLQKVNIKNFIDATIRQNNIETDKIFVTVVEGLKHGVTGIAANQILREFGRPAILLILEDNEAMGAARSIDSFDIISALDECKDVIIKYGGHKAAAGLTVSKSRLDEFRKRIKFIANSLITDDMLIPQLPINISIPITNVSIRLVKELELLEPYGFGNEQPIFILSEVILNSFSSVGMDGAHLRVNFKNDKTNINGIGWQLGRRAADFKKGQKVDVVFQLELNIWQSKESAQLKILDIKSSDGII
ncbi:MAG: single-stranded-DNA-specific exonuclease RecJ [Elusimicrobia bacterium]|nr:single-stranded-DNA-specific exonuclease RecJ [Elusimicrobiota bacterium]